MQVAVDVEMKTAEELAAETARYEQYERLVQDAAAIEEQRMHQAQRAQPATVYGYTETSLDQANQMPLHVDTRQISVPDQTVYTTPAAGPENVICTAPASQTTTDVDMDQDMMLAPANPHATETGFSSVENPTTLDNHTTLRDLDGTSNDNTEDETHDPSVTSQEPYNIKRETVDLTRAMSEDPPNHITPSTDGVLTNCAIINVMSSADHHEKPGHQNGILSAGNILPAQEKVVKGVDGEEDKENMGGGEDDVQMED